MPKMKTNRLLSKKTTVNAKGKVKRAQAGMNHFTGKKSAKRNRQRITTVVADKTAGYALQRMLPFAGVKR